MFFKNKKNEYKEEATEQLTDVSQEATAYEADKPETEVSDPVASEYAFYKPDPYPKELVSVLKSMIQRLFPDTKRAYILEARKSDKKGYLLIVDIDSSFLKIINIYLDGETKKVRGDIPIECILYSKSGSLTEGIDPFYTKDNPKSNANNLASKDFSGDIVFSRMPEFDLWSGSEKKDTVLPEDMTSVEPGADAADKEITDSEEDKKPINSKPPVIIPMEKSEKKTSNLTKVKPTTKKELFGIINEYGFKKSGEVSTVAMTAIREFEFYIPYSLGVEAKASVIEGSLPIDDNLRFRCLVHQESEDKAVPLFTDESAAMKFAGRDKCLVSHIKFKDFVASRAAELTAYNGVVINPDDEALYLKSNHPLLG